jgi:isocitrate lyase
MIDGFGNEEATYLLTKNDWGWCLRNSSWKSSFDAKQCGHQDKAVPHEDFIAKINAIRYAF